VFSLEYESDAERLRQAARLLDRENARLITENLRLTRENEQLKGLDPKALELRLQYLEEQLSKARQEMYGRSSEKLERPAREETPKEPQTGHGPSAQPSLPVVEVIHVLDDPDLICPKCGKELQEWPGQFEESEEVTVVERKFVLTQHKRQKYRCQCQSCVETALGPVKLFPGARYSAGFAVHVAIAKYADHLPLERQARMMKRDGLRVTSQTLWDQILALKTVCEPLHERIWKDVHGSPVIFADETPWRMLKSNDGGRWYVWEIASHRSACYRILDSRSKEAALKILGGYQGTVVADGYGVYEALARDGPGFRLANCWAHARRYFYEVRDRYPEECGWFLDRIGELYTIERDAVPGVDDDTLSLQGRRTRRLEQSLPVVKAIRQKALELKPVSTERHGLRQAVNYLLNQWDGLTVFLDDPHIPLDNNLAERTLRGAALGRKNHLGSKSPRGADVAAFFYSVVESCKLNGVDPARYLRDAAQAFLTGQKEFPVPHSYQS